MGNVVATDLNSDGQADLVIGGMALNAQTGAFLVNPSSNCTSASGPCSSVLWWGEFGFG
ncbi:MAG: hypothetical protein R3C68_14225 [Myxococcota bacterium]